MDIQKKSTWLERVEDLIDILEGSSISELELTEQGTEIIIRRQPSMVLTAAPTQHVAAQAGLAGGAAPATSVERSVPIVTPLTGVYYSAASPSSPPFVNIGDTVHAGQVVALIEAMKVFNEVTADVSGRVVELPAKNGEVIQKGDVLIRVETP
jgi:acetyl-CoA carboxylase biotin carboxyl carrier protein